VPEDLDLQQRIASLSVEQRAELERRLLASAQLGRGRAGIPRRGPGDTWPMSFGQQRLWVLHQLEPSSAAYNLPRATRIQGPLDGEALRRSIDALVERHESLRTRFATQEGEPVQVIGPPVPVELPFVDLGALGPEARDAELTRQLAEEAHAPFDLARDLMVRGRLFRLGAEEHVLVLTLHHIASDGLSGSVLDREVAALYTAFAAGQPPSLPPLPIQYADYTLWHRRCFEGTADEQLRYWRDRLAGAPPTLDLPTDRPRPAIATYRGGRQIETLPSGLVAAVGALGRRLRATPFMVFLAVFKALMARYCRQPDVVVGTAIAGRTRLETEGLIGFFVNTLVLRTDLSGDPTVTELVERVRQTALGAYGHQETPFERLVQELRPERLRDRSPLIQVAFVMQDAARRPLPIRGLTTAPVEVTAEAAPFDLSLSLVPEAGEMAVRASYSTDLFERDTIARLLDHYRMLLESAVADPTQRLSALPMLGADDARRIAEWNATARPYPADAGLAELFAAQVRRAPDAPAVLAAGEPLSYRALDRRANQLAHRLRGSGVRRGDRVGICLDRSVEMIVAMVGVMKAGAAYVPIDPANPEERRAFLLGDAGAAALISGAGASGSAAVPGIVLGEAGDALADESPEPFDGGASGDDLAYVMYTSGSMGQPKGVAVPQRAVSRLVMNADYLQLGPGDVVGHASNVAFDAATFEIWGALLNGARLVVLPKEVILSPGDLDKALAAHGVTALFLTTTLFHQTARELPTAFKGVRHTMFGGEAVEPRWVERVLSHGPPERLLNMYGPTETTTFATWHDAAAAPPAGGSVPIGRPIANTHVRVLGADLRPLPVGVPGELFIGGPGLAWGYHGRPDLTAERFVPDAWSEEPGARLYRTGDVARYRADGAIEFLGRADRQLKLRGYRIEPGEIEAALDRHPGVHHSAVDVRPDGSGGSQLVAYVVPRADAPGAADLRRFLAGALPAYMIPARVVALPRLPLMPSGKIDYQSLPAPTAAPAERAADLVMPWSPLAHQLAEVWERLLDVRPIGVHDNFFELGGHSLLAVRMVLEVERASGRRVGVSTLYSAPTIAALEDAIVRQEAPTFLSRIVKIKDGDQAPFFFFHGDFNGGGFYSTSLARALGRRPFYLVHPHGLNGDRVPTSIEAMAEDYMAHVRGIQPHGPYYLGGLCNGGLVAFELARQLRAQGEPVAFVGVLDATASPGWRREVSTRLRSIAERADDALGRLRYYRRRLRGRSPRANLGALRRAVAETAARARADRAAAPAPVSGATEFDGPDVLGRTQAFTRAVRRYVPSRYDGRVTLFVAESGRSAGSEDRGWRQVAGDVQIHVIPGEHLTFITRYVEVLGERLRDALDAAERG